MKKIVNFFVATFFCGYLCAVSFINTITNFKPVVQLVELFHSTQKDNVWLVLDLDQTIITPVDPFLHFNNLQTVYAALELYKREFHNIYTIEELYLRLLNKAKYQITDSIINKLFKTAEIYHYNVLILTAAGHGYCGGYKNKIEEVRLGHLNSVLNSYNNSQFHFESFFNQYNLLQRTFDGQDGRPLLYNYILFCGRNNKGEVLTKFFEIENSNASSRQVVFIDNFISNVQRVDRAIKIFSAKFNMSIDFYGFEYTLWNQSQLMDVNTIKACIEEYFADEVWDDIIDGSIENVIFPVQKSSKKCFQCALM